MLQTIIIIFFISFIRIDELYYRTLKLYIYRLIILLNQSHFLK